LGTPGDDYLCPRGRLGGIPGELGLVLLIGFFVTVIFSTGLDA
jgi:hypothetical protein